MKNLTDYCNAMLLALLGDPDLIHPWWTTPNLAFEGQCPDHVDEQTVKKYLEEHCFR